MTDLLEATMIICFGISWPINIIKAWKAKTARGTSVLFYFFIWLGYVAGIICKVIQANEGKYNYNYVFFFYILNIVMVSCGIIIYFRNKMLDKKTV